MPESADKKTNWLPAIALLVVAIGFVGFAVWYRADRRRAVPAPTPEAATVAPGADAQAALDAMLADEQAAFESTCSLCHALPNIKLYDKAAWPGVGRKMKDRMADRMDAAILHLVHNAREPMRFPPPATTSAPALTPALP